MEERCCTVHPPGAAHTGGRGCAAVKFGACALSGDSREFRYKHASWLLGLSPPFALRYSSAFPLSLCCVLLSFVYQITSLSSAASPLHFFFSFCLAPLGKVEKVVL